tara:strand:- start:763 stop:1047 length:285 start_codon:yes stop_codon:yes gene_type:complete
MKYLKAFERQFSKYMDGSGTKPVPADIKAYQKCIIRISKTSQGNAVRKVAPFVEPTEENPYPNIQKSILDIKPPVSTESHQSLLKAVIARINNV